jgi:S-adenosylmethionine synthetase
MACLISRRPAKELANSGDVMARQDYIFTSESVSEGHPDKVCDLISDSVLDAFVAKEPEARVAVETLTTTNKIVLAGEVRPTGLISAEEMANIARERCPGHRV